MAGYVWNVEQNSKINVVYLAARTTETFDVLARLPGKEDG